MNATIMAYVACALLLGAGATAATDIWAIARKSLLLVGIGTVAAPFLLMQPGMGAGIAASRTPRPAAGSVVSALHMF